MKKSNYYFYWQNFNKYYIIEARIDDNNKYVQWRWLTDKQWYYPLVTLKKFLELNKLGVAKEQYI